MEKISIEERIKHAICKIYVDDVYVTGFLFKDSYLMSAGHMFENIDEKSQIKAKFINGDVIDVKVEYYVYDKNSGIDFSILKLKHNATNRMPLPLSFYKYTKGKVMSIGASSLLKDFSSAEGNIIGHHILNESNYMLKINSGQLGQFGFSGAPIFSIEEQAVIAIQSETTENEHGPERDTVLAFPLERLLRDNYASNYISNKNTIKASEYIENYLLPMFGRSLLRLEHSDNLDAYMRCIVVKLLPEQDSRFTVFVAKNSNNTLVPVIRKHHKTRRMRYGIVGGMIRANVPIMYDFVNNKCYQLELGGTSRESIVINKNNKGAKENRIALLVAPIRDTKGKIVGVLSFDFFPTQNPDKNIINIIKNDSSELGKILYLSELYAQTISQLLLCNYIVDIDFFNVQPF